MSAAADFEAGRTAFLESRFDDAEAALGRSLAADSDHFDAKVYLARVHDGQGRLEDAIALYRDALMARSDHAAVHLLLAQSLLAAGRYAEGWAEYEWRYKGAGGQPFPNIEAPLWRGDALDGRTILVIGEQGYGDVIQFARFLPRVKAAGGRVALGVSQPLFTLSESLAGADHRFHDWHHAGRFDTYCPLSSLPGALGITAADLPGPIPYVAADSRRQARWARRLANNVRRRIGICWAGRPNHPNDRYRSVPFDILRRYLPADANVFSLQKGEAAGAIAGSNVIDLSARLHDFAETAAVIAQLDLVVSVDTSLAHLAGAMGKPVHVLLPYVPDWRWGRTVDSSPWYPSARLFRQAAPGDWSGSLAAAFA